MKVARRGLLLPVVVLAAACAVVLPPTPPGSPSARLLAGGPFEVGRRSYTLVDRSRPHDPRGGDAAGAPRRLQTTIWFPRGAPGPHPLVLYSHGFLSTRRGGAYLGEWLASRGYVVAAPDHPLTAGWACGDRVVDDVVNQPADLRFVADTMLAWGDDEGRPFDGPIDPERIGVMGLSLGGMTVTLAAFHPRLRDPRIRAAVSIAGPMTIFGPAFFSAVPVPFLMVAGDADVVIDYATNAPLVAERVPGGQLVTIAGASHVGFDEKGAGVLRALRNPDRLACSWLSLRLDLGDSRETLAALRGEDDGVIVPASTPRPCAATPPWETRDPARQHLITKLAVGAFFDSRLASDPVVRRVAAEYLLHDLARDFPEVRSERGP